ncbi:hypothetical protein LINJ_35_1360 [Leishmania infantum JPCM5]|uniref:Uncharacterized protein n=2 Tax=Leishmania infantum TaxID=5671 RepID=E9AHU5_LEIIN|nr:hypothetical protein LINJ_35_1360 [Leishmania infantum JPCM5]CAC9543798.1 hypothetical_protein_-_conserved [Leishmania infantum]CBZ08998.1 hypothetical protein LINJ_35_1360 [Leishmania infantum JPCM5]SUZ45964.1 hypothetical_protein_-_conserved [Leishmania infantum]|eukprot:XP_003392796.1 hypothetical protein LINJ_35_1360 [Leishmania infantum JPCM5]
MADSHSTSAAPAASSPCSVYRLKHNPSWTKFGMHPAMLADINARSGRPTSRRASSCGSSAANSAVPSASASLLSTASARQPASSGSLAAVGAQAALRHEHKQAHAASRSMSLRATAFNASGIRGVSQSLVSDSAFSTSRARGGSDVKARAPESASLSQPAATRGESPAASAPVSTTFRDKGGSCDHGTETPRTPNDTRSSDFTDSSWRAETTRDPSLQPSVLPLREASSSRAKVSHLMGSAALVEVAGPLDALYVPLRRPAPRGCVATRQHFSIFERTHCQGVPVRSATEARAAVAAHRVAHIGHRGVVGGSPETDTYRTTNSAYGRGC